MFNRGSLL